MWNGRTCGVSSFLADATGTCSCQKGFNHEIVPARDISSMVKAATRKKSGLGALSKSTIVGELKANTSAHPKDHVNIFKDQRPPPAAAQL
ncbi:hypothetical protein G7K_5711-t1 [Saitoella complicata NRRL Y-17804]|uniref:Uncharacterized protein n=1 Tax=Saitoella complicata (strain BCRC 22490 / CBS 7301 / JCM 7358 / NBRC 10748 / NRRL Y-17804) TaxID=698492 RepID=A0A0E9NQB2_SAICN|nr:hypothetical protein G7K_5711-t1 [Saitoella complicata NRRL Y-17804]